MGIELLAAGATLVSGAMGADSNRKAANTQADATRAAQAEQARQYDLAREDLAPYRQTGVNALQMLARANGLDGGTMGASEIMEADPGYQFRLQQGQQAMDRRFAAQGGRFSGASLKAASDYNQGMAAQGFGDRMNRLAALAGIGQTATNTTSGLGANAANQISGLISSQGDATAAARLNQGNIWGNTVNSIGAQYRRGGGGGFGNAQAAFSNTGLGSSGFGTGMAYGNEDMGAYLGG